VLEMLNNIISAISAKIGEVKQGQSSDVQKVLESILSDLTKNDKDDKSEIADQVLQQLIAMIQGNATILATPEKASQADSAVAILQSIVPVQATAKTTTPVVVTITTPVAVTNTDNATAETIASTTQVAVAPEKTTNATTNSAGQVSTNAVSATAPTISNDLQGIQNKLTKLLGIVEQKINATQISSDVKAVVSTNTITDDTTKLSAQSQVLKLSLLGNKVIKNNSELDELVASTQVAKSTQPVAIENPVSAKNIEVPVEKQVSQTIANQLSSKVTSNGTQELTLMLNPKDLGEVSIRLVKEGGAITVSIVAQNPETQKLLQDRLPNLISNLQASNAEVKDVQVVTPNQNATGSMSGFSLSDSNSNNQQNARQAHTQTNTSYDTKQTEEVKETQEYHGEGKLWQTA